jgi:hypothetical protein
MRGGEQDAVRSELAQRIDSLSHRAAGNDARQLASDLDSIRRLAAAHGLGAMTPVIHAIEAALGRGERGPHVASGLALLRDAVHCAGDARSVAALAAACSRRVAG